MFKTLPTLALLATRVLSCPLVVTAVKAVPSVTAVPVVNAKAVWQPPVGDKWQIVIKGSPDWASFPSISTWDIDLFETSKEDISKLHADGKKVICYFSAGTYENWRPDQALFLESDKAAKLPQWPGEQWLQLKSENVWEVMQKRIALAATKGCDAIDPDNMDGYSNEGGGGFDPPLTESDSITFLKRMAAEARQYGLAIGLKNSESILSRVADEVQFAVNEECHAFGGCDRYAEFARSKPVYNIEYSGASSAKQVCGTAGFSTLIKELDLDNRTTFCDANSASSYEE